MGNPTKELRAKLDELGIEWKSETDCDTYWYGQDRTFYKFTEYNDGTTSFSTCQWNLTPKQVLTAPIAATVGERDTMELWPEWEQVLFANVSDEVAQDNLNECVHELLDKAATVGVGTCTIEPHGYYDEQHGIYTCSSCGQQWQFEVEGPMEHGWTCCPHCRARIKEDAE